MGRGLTKAERLQQMIWLYLQRGYTDIEMAERLGVDRTTVYRDRLELETEHIFIHEIDGRYRLDRMQYMPNIKVNLHEALALYLAARRASRQTRIAQPHTASALEKLAVALKQPMTERLTHSALHHPCPASRSTAHQYSRSSHTGLGRKPQSSYLLSRPPFPSSQQPSPPPLPYRALPLDRW